MPPKVFKIPLLTGGVNSQADTAYVKDEESTNLTNFIPNRRGRIRLSGSMEVETIEYDNSNESIALTVTDDYHTSGYGLYYFRADHTMLSANNTYIVNGSPVEVVDGVDYYVFQDNRYTKIYDSVNARFLQTRLDGGGANITTSPFVLPTYYYADNALRVCAAHTANIGGTSYHKRYLGFIERKLFGYTSTDVTFWVNHKRWYQDTAKIMTPSASSYSQTIGSEKPGKMNSQIIDLDGDSTDNFTTINDEGIKFYVGYSPSVTGTWKLANTYKIYASYIYDGSQESNVLELANFSPDVDNKGVRVAVEVDYADGNSANSDNTGVALTDLNISPRITGAVLYFSDSEDGDKVLYRLFEVDFIKGCRKFTDTSYTSWGVIQAGQRFDCPAGASGGIAANSFLFLDPLKISTYEDINGYGPEEDLSPEFNCAAMVGKSVFIGNVKIGDEVFNDRIMFSPINSDQKPQYDTFPETHILDIGADDGDRITQLISDGEKLIVFKEKSVSVLNVSKFGAEFVEQSFKYIGIKNPCQAVLTNYGVCWINSTGCYLLKNNELINLIDGKILQDGRLKQFQKNMLWSISDSNINNMPSIGYYPKQQQLIIAVNIAEDASVKAQDCWIFDFKQEAWSYHSNALDTHLVRSNFINDNKGNLYQTGGNNTSGTPSNDTLTLSYWNNDSVGKTECAYVTKDLNFGSPGINKKIYKVGLTYRIDTSTTNIKPLYGLNGEDAITETFISNQGDLNSSGLLEAPSSAISTETLKLYVDGVFNFFDSSHYYMVQGSQANEGGVVGDIAYLQYETTVTSSNWTIASGGSFLSIAGGVFVFTGSGDAVATHTFSTASAISRGAEHTLKFNIASITDNMTIQIIGLNIEDGGETTLATPSQYTSTGVKTVTFTPSSTSHTTYKIKFLNSGSLNATTINNINLHSAFMTETASNKLQKTAFNLGTAGSPTLPRYGGFITVNQTNTTGSGHYITVTNSTKHQIKIHGEGTTGSGQGFELRLIDIGTSSTDIPNLKDLATYDSNSGSNYPQSVPLEGDGINGTSADFATITANSTYTLTTVNNLNTSNRYHIVVAQKRFSGTINGWDWDWWWFSRLSMKELGNWRTGFLNFDNPVTCKSFQLMLKNSGTASASFEVRDIEIFYRVLKPKLTSD